ncbi:MAG: CBS domain-containing protein [Candidatus Syntropharchaeales archaeon]|nr:CBS domain-containing protein [Candidatus Syntrophoarchaeum sp.]
MMDTRLAVKNIMIRDVVVAETGATVREIAKLMEDRNVDSVIILESTKPVGIVTHGDIVRNVILKEKSPNSTPVKEIMTSPLITTTPLEDLNTVTKNMYRRGIRKMPVIEDGKLVGIVADVDIIVTCTGMNTILTDLIEMNSDTAFLHEGMPEKISEYGTGQGICENCGTFSSNLEVVGGMMLCETCREELQVE